MFTRVSESNSVEKNPITGFALFNKSTNIVSTVRRLLIVYERHPTHCPRNGKQTERFFFLFKQNRRRL